jgi:putative transposase
VLYGKLKRALGEILSDLCRQKGVDLFEGHLMTDHVQMYFRVPPKHSIIFVIDFLQGKMLFVIIGKAEINELPGSI